MLRENVIKIPEAKRRTQAKKHLFRFKQAGGRVLSPAGTGLGVCAACQLMLIPSAQHPTLLPAEIMESQHRLDWKNPLRTSSPTILPVPSSCLTIGSCTQGWAIIALQSSRLNVTFRKKCGAVFPKTSSSDHCTAALGLSLVYRLALPSMSPSKTQECLFMKMEIWGCPWCQQPSPHVSSAPAPSHTSAKTAKTATVSLWQSPAALASACLGNTSPSAWR